MDPIQSSWDEIDNIDALSTNGEKNKIFAWSGIVVAG